jgi:hypothetical protein
MHSIFTFTFTIDSSSLLKHASELQKGSVRDQVWRTAGSPLKVLSSEIDIAKSGLLRKAFTKGSGVEIFS